MSIPSLFGLFVREALERKWHLVEAKCGAHGAQTLLAHSLNAMSVTYSVGKVLGWSEDKLRLAVASRAVHDIAKKRWKCGKERPPKGMNEEEEKEAREILRHLGLSEEEISVAISLAQKDETFGNIKDFMAGAKHEAIAPDVLDLAMLGDRLASMKDPSEPVYKDTEARLKRLGLFITYHKVSVVRGISTYLLHRALIELYQQKGFAPVLFFSSGVVYVGKKEAPRLTREEVLRSLEETLTSFLREKKRELGRAAIGVVSQKAIKAPEYVFVDEDVAKALWNLLTKQKSVADPSVKDNDLSAKGFGSYLGDELTLGEREAAIKFYKGMKYLLTYFNNLLKSAKEDFGVK
ncbi:MAG: type I-D CRISPR-associated protein Cas10d/Csc3, partial [Thermoproteota archaeon]